MCDFQRMIPLLVMYKYQDVLLLDALISYPVVGSCKQTRLSQHRAPMQALTRSSLVAAPPIPAISSSTLSILFFSSSFLLSSLSLYRNLAPGLPYPRRVFPLFLLEAIGLDALPGLNHTPISLFT